MQNAAEIEKARKQKPFVLRANEKRVNIHYLKSKRRKYLHQDKINGLVQNLVQVGLGLNLT